MLRIKSNLPKFTGMVIGFALLLLSLPAVILAADVYPSKPVTFVIPHEPGGANDTVGRLIALKLAERLGPFVVDNRGGAGGRVGVKYASKRKPDGYTVVFTSVSIVANHVIYKSENPLEIFTPVAKVAAGALGVVAHPGVPVNSMKDLIELAKRKPGELIMASASVGSITNVGAELFKSMAGLDVKTVIFKGGGPALIDVLGGHSHFLFGSLPQLVPHIQAGKLKALGVTTKSRVSILPNVAVVADVLPGYEVDQWYGLFAPTGTPAAIIDKLSKAIKEVLTLDEVKKRYAAEGSEIDYMGPAEFKTFLEGNIAHWFNIIKATGFKAE